MCPSGAALTDNQAVTLMRLRSPLLLVLGLVSAGACASTGATPRPFPAPTARPPADPALAVATSGTLLPADGYSITGTALGLRGTPYRNGGSDPRGFDCSGFVEYVFGQHGIALPRTVEALYRAGTPVEGRDLRAGDLVFFSTTAPGPSHVGMAIGGDEFVHAPSSAGVVRVERLSGTYWAARFIGARRVVN